MTSLDSALQSTVLQPFLAEAESDDDGRELGATASESECPVQSMHSTRIAPHDPTDLHLHTTYSDGQWQPAALFAYLAREGFRLVAVTDHDHLEHVPEMQAIGATHDIVVLAGVEVTTHWHDLSAHLLCYAPSLSGDMGTALGALTHATEAAQLENTRAVYAELLRRGYAFPRQAEVLADQQGALRRPSDNLLLLHAHGHATSAADAYEMIRDAGYRSISAPLADAVAAAHASGATAVLAHPGRGGGEISRYDPPLLDTLLAEVPLDGIEAHYPTHTPAQTAAYLDLAQRRHLLVSAGSDSHGPRQRFPVRYPASTCSALLACLGVRVAS